MSALRASRAMGGAPLKAAAGQATTVKRDPGRLLASNEKAQKKGRICSLIMQLCDLLDSIFASSGPNALGKKL